MPNEIITLQLGHYSNYVGAHWWNMQESSFKYDGETEISEINHDILFREGCNYRGETTFTPRLVLVDLNGSLGTLPVQGTLYDSPNYGKEEGHFMWDENVDMHQSTLVPRNQFLRDLHDEDELYEQRYSTGATNGNHDELKPCTSKSIQNGDCSPRLYDLDKEIQTWSDFKKVHYHPRSTLLIKKHYQNTDGDSFNSWTAGMNEAKSGVILGQVEEAVRSYAEECDCMQGFHILTDAYDGFGGLSSVVMEYIKDEFSGKSRACFPTFPVFSETCKAAKLRSRTMSSVLTMSSLLETSSFVCPLSLSQALFQGSAKGRSFPHLIYDASSQYHTSAIIAASLEAATCAYRQRSNAFSLLNLVENLTSGSRRLLEMQSALPLPYDVDQYSGFADMLCNYVDQNPWQPITPGTSLNSCQSQTTEQIFSQVVSLNGLPKWAVQPQSTSNASMQTELHKCVDSNSMLKLYMDGRFQSSNNIVNVISDPVMVTTSFPQIFSNKVGCDGMISTNKVTMNYSDPYTEHLLNGTESSKVSSRQDGAKNSSLDAEVIDSLSRKLRTSSCTAKRTPSISKRTESVPMLTNFSTSSRLCKLLGQCHKQGTVMMRWASRYQHSESGVEEELLEEAIEKFKTLEQDYA
ncbi:protein misato homolog 1-like [Clavelina lepadiformis]|uniref:Protein misato homolog 1 n=1 Tax=Clavelina lepadiformis TaxID=159417 RepID=A0ABP0GL59_CLALP